MTVKYNNYVNKDKIKSEPNNDEILRYKLVVPLNNSNNKNMIIIMMNPSHANEKNSDTTVNSVLDYAYNKYKKVIILNVIPLRNPNSADIKKGREKYIVKYGKDNYDEKIEENLCQIKSTIKEEMQLNTDIYLATGNTLSNEGLHSMKVLYNTILHEKSVYAFKSIRNDKTKNKQLTVKGFTFHPSRQNKNAFFNDQNKYEFKVDSYENRGK